MLLALGYREIEGSPVTSPKKLSHTLVEKKEALLACPSRQGVRAGNEVFKGEQVLGWASPGLRELAGASRWACLASAACAKGAPRHLRNWGMDTRHRVPGTREADGELCATVPLSQHPGKPATRALGRRKPHSPHPTPALPPPRCPTSLHLEPTCEESGMSFWLSSLSGRSSPIQVSVLVGSGSSEGPSASLRDTANQNEGLVALGTLSDYCPGPDTLTGSCGVPFSTLINPEFTWRIT